MGMQSEGEGDGHVDGHVDRHVEVGLCMAWRGIGLGVLVQNTLYEVLMLSTRRSGGIQQSWQTEAVNLLLDSDNLAAHSPFYS